MELHAAVSDSVTCSELSFLFVNDSVGSCRRMLRCHSDLLNQNDNETDCVVRKLQGCTHFAEIVQKLCGKPGFWENVLVFLAFTLKLSIQTLLSVAPTRSVFWHATQFQQKRAHSRKKYYWEP